MDDVPKIYFQQQAKVHKNKNTKENFPSSSLLPARDASGPEFALTGGVGTKSMKFWLTFASSELFTNIKSGPRVTRPLTCKVDSHLSRKKCRADISLTKTL